MSRFRPARIAASTFALVVGGPSLFYYMRIVRPRLLHQEHVAWMRSVPPPIRRTPLFVAGGEPMMSVRDAAQVAKSDIFDNASLLQVALFYCRVAWRMSLLVTRAIPVALLYLMARSRLLGVSYDLAHIALRDLLASMGPSFIKLGQWAATRPDVFGVPLCKALSTLFDSAPPHHWKHTEQTLARAGILEFVEAIEKEPLNSGSIAQVHKAVLKKDYTLNRSEVDPGTLAALGLLAQSDGVAGKAAPSPASGDRVVVCKAGTPLVLKVMHPGVRETMLADSCALQALGSLITWLVPGSEFMSLRQTAEEVAGLAVSQLNLEREADNLMQFRFNFRDDVNDRHRSLRGVQQIVFPTPLTEMSTRDVLVETFEVGEAINDWNLPTYAPVGHVAVNMFMKMIFVDNLIHADLHPGNMLFRVRNPDGSLATASGAQPGFVPQLVVLDPGLVTSLSERERRNFVSLFAAVASGDGEMGAQLMHDFSPGPNLCPDVDKFKADIRKIFDAVCPAGIGFSLSAVSFADKMNDVMNAMRNHKVRIDMNFATLVATVVVGEGMGRRLVPDFNIVEEALPFLLTCLRSQELDFLAKKLQETYLTSAVSL